MLVACSFGSKAGIGLEKNGRSEWTGQHERVTFTQPLEFVLRVVQNRDLLGALDNLQTILL